MITRLFFRDDMHFTRTSGFTLIELSIVLVIIGLVIGGVLVGQDMIRNASIRGTIGQLEKYNAALHTFRNKYEMLPGDLTEPTESQFGFFSRTNAAGHGDNNGQIDGCTVNVVFVGCEVTLFWRDLSHAGLVEGSYTSATDALATNLTSSDGPLYFPQAKTGRGSDIIAYGHFSRSYFQITDLISTDGSGTSAVQGRLTPQEAFEIDSKIDDGRAMAGIAQAMRESGQLASTAIPSAPAVGVCVTSLSGFPYNLGTADYANAPSCQLRVQFSR